MAGNGAPKNRQKQSGCMTLLSRNWGAGWVSVGMNADTTGFAIGIIRRWWREIGRASYPDTTYLTITAPMVKGATAHGFDYGRLSNELRIDIVVHHPPSGTSERNKIEHYLFSFITMNWCDRPLVSHAVIVALISATTMEAGLKVRCEKDEAVYTKGTKVPDTKLSAINRLRDEFHDD